MCYVVYGAINQTVDAYDYEKIAATHTYRFNFGTKHDIKMCVANESDEFRVTDWVCDCDFPIGAKDENAIELQELASLIRSLRQAKDAKSIYLCKTWNGRRNKREIVVKMDEIELVAFLANMEMDCLYQINL